MSRRRKQTSPKKRSQSRQQTADGSRLALKQERAERKQALERERATSEILRVIAESQTDAQPVFDTIVRNAVRLCGGMFSNAYRYDGEQMHLVATTSKSVELRKILADTFPMRPDQRHVSGRAILAKATRKIEDVLADPAYDHRFATTASWRRILAVPMLRSGEPIGVIAVVWAKPGPVSKRQEELLQTFADQAVIAVENVRLFNETKEALEQQTATADILGVISRSPSDIEPVLQAVAERAALLCEATDVHIRLVQGELMPPAVQLGSIPVYYEESSVQRITRESPPGRAILECRTIHIHDIQQPEVRSEYPEALFYRRPDPGFRTILVVPLVRGTAAIGSITVRRAEMRPFSEQQIKLLQIFAEQAVIAIENVRLFNETNDALERQTATADILKVIAASPADVQPVFDAVAESAARLCNATDVIIRRIEGGGVLRAVAHIGSIPLPAEVAAIPVSPKNVAGRAVIERRTIHIHDVTEDSMRREYPEAAFLAQRGTGFRTLLVVPLVRNDAAVGLIAVRREEKHPFSDQQIGLLQTFADQAVIAIENARLFNETKEALEQQTATSEILGVISSSPTDIAPVFDAILKNATELSGAHLGILNLRDGEGFRTVAQRSANAEFAKYAFERGAFKPVGATARMILERQAVQVPDLREGDAYRAGQAGAVKWIEMSGARSFLAVPLLKEGQVIGFISIYRPEVRPFSQEQIRLVSTFASQAVIAIENVRLFNETKEALEQQTATAEILRVISSSPTDIQPVLDAVAATAARLCGASDAVIRRVDGDVLQLAAKYGAIPSDTKARPINRGSVSGRAVLERQTIHICDVLDDAELTFTREMARRHGFRTVLSTPLLREGQPIGAISIRRPETRLFSDSEVKLLQTFADQAVIAIENVRLFKELQATNANLRETLEQQTATAEILKVISKSPTDARPVFETIVRSSVHLCSGAWGAVFTCEGNMFHLGAQVQPTPEAEEAYRRGFPQPIDDRTPSGRAIVERRPVNVADIHKTDYAQGVKDRARLAGWRSVLTVPMMRDDVPIGAVAVTREEATLFDESYVALLQTFADQAVIAIENARLFNETKEALEQQTATAEILRVMSGSPSDVQPVFETVARKTSELCNGNYAVVVRFDGELIHLVAEHNARQGSTSPAQLYPRRPGRDTPSARAVLERTVVHIPYADKDPDLPQEFVRGVGAGSFLAVPLLRDGRPIGVIGASRVESGPFPAKQIELVKVFAAQAVIAIENARLFKELQARTEALTKSVNQLTALGEVGQAISSTLELDRVLNTIVQRAVQLAELDGGWIYEFDQRDEGFHLRAAEHIEQELLEMSRKSPIRLGEGAVGRAGTTREPVVVEDVLDPSYQSRVRELLIKAGSRAVLAVPLVRENLLLGALAVSRRSPGPFAPDVIDLLKTFATQSAVAIQNARLFNETKEALDQQKASAEVLTAISSSIADTKPVFDKILESCQRVFAGRNVGIIIVGEDGKMHIGAYSGPGSAELEAHYPVPLSMESGSGTAILQRQVAHYPDCNAPGVPAFARRGAHIGGNKSMLFAPMVWEGKGVGVIFVGRPVTGPFSEKEIALLRTFADQAVIAIQNARLFREIAEKGKQLEVASQHKSQFLASMSHELRTPLNAILGFNEMMLDGLCGEVPAGFKDPLDETQKSGKHLLRLINNVLDLAKIEAGRMELALADYSVHDTVESVRSTLRPLAAEKGLEFLANVPADIPLAYGDAGRITQCLVNLAGNSLKFTKEGRVEISVRQQDGQLRYCVADTGIGIPPERIGSLFTEFKQTDPTIASEYGGTGLGLSITKKFIEMHGGRIWVESEIGKGSEFIFEIPLKLGK